MSVLLTWLSGAQELGASLDAVLTETHSRSASVTSHPVEKGADVSDHLYVEPVKLSLEVVVTNTPTSTPDTHANGARGEVSEGRLQFDGEMMRPVYLWRDLRDAFTKKAVFTVDTVIEQYSDMVITSLSVPREAGSAATVDDKTRIDKLQFSIEMQQIRVVGSRDGKVTRKPKIGTPKKKDNKGDAGKKDATELESSAHSALY